MTMQMMVDGEWVDLPARSVEFTSEPVEFADAVESSMRSTYSLDIPIASEVAESLTTLLNRLALEAWWRRHGWLRAMLSTRTVHLPTCGRFCASQSTV